MDKPNTRDSACLYVVKYNICNRQASNGMHEVVLQGYSI